MSEGVPVVDGLFAETAQGPRLLGSRCASCATPYFPKSPACHNPNCTDSKVQEAEFGPSGTLWSVAIQSYPPPPPAKYDEPYKPYALGVIDLDDGLRVLGRVSSDNFKQLRPGMRVELVIEPLHHREDGSAVVTWKFKPVSGEKS